MMPPRAQRGTWTPAFTFATAGDLSVTYSEQAGYYYRVAKIIVAIFDIVSSAFTHTTASGNATISGLPFAATNQNNLRVRGALEWGGITKANYTNVVTVLAGNATTMNLIASGSGQAPSLVTAANMPTGGTVQLRGTIVYHTDT